MGGFGSGRPSVRHRPHVESLKRLDIAYLQRNGFLTVGACKTIHWSRGSRPSGSIGIIAHGDCLRLKYRSCGTGQTWESVDERVEIEWTKQTFGGRRPRFLCPQCLRRCRVLLGAVRFRCRRCSGARYASQSETKADRAIRRMRKISQRVDPSGNGIGMPLRPKGMHRKTYARLSDKYEGHGATWNKEAMRLMGLDVEGDE